MSKYEMWFNFSPLILVAILLIWTAITRKKTGK